MTDRQRDSPARRRLVPPAALWFTEISAYEASVRLASEELSLTAEDVERRLRGGGTDRDDVFDAFGQSTVICSVGSPITRQQVQEEWDS